MQLKQHSQVSQVPTIALESIIFSSHFYYFIPFGIHLREGVFLREVCTALWYCCN